MTGEARAAVQADERWTGVAQPEEVAEVIAYLASEAAGRVTGDVIRMA